MGLTLDDYLEPYGHRLEPEAGPPVADTVAAETAGSQFLGVMSPATSNFRRLDQARGDQLSSNGCEGDLPDRKKVDDAGKDDEDMEELVV